jgi:hypothetical protein
MVRAMMIPAISKEFDEKEEWIDTDDAAETGCECAEHFEYYDSEECLSMEYAQDSLLKRA